MIRSARDGNSAAWVAASAPVVTHAAYSVRGSTILANMCGHSYGGCVIGGVADRVPERIGALVYLDAFVLESGDNLAEHVPEPQYKQMLEAVQAVGEGWKVPPIPAEVFNVNATDREWVNRQCTMQPLDTFEQRIRLSGGARKIVNVTFVLAKGFVETKSQKASAEEVAAALAVMEVDNRLPQKPHKPNDLAFAPGAFKLERARAFQGFGKTPQDVQIEQRDHQITKVVKGKASTVDHDSVDAASRGGGVGRPVGFDRGRNGHAPSGPRTILPA